MSFTLRGNLSALGCEDCPISLAGATVRVYASLPDSSVTQRAAVDPRHTFRLFHHADAEAQAALTASHGPQIGEAVIDPTGAYSVTLAADYQGGTLDVDLYCGTVAGHVPPHPNQMSLTTLQPVWRQAAQSEAADEQVAAFDYVVPSRLWCATLASLGLWIICGQVTLCKTDQAIAGVTVSAFDRDWLQDDPLGSALTDSAGHFQIWYTAAQFSKTPFSPLINIELVPGPDLYFRIEGPSSAVLLAEPPDTGRTPGRQNVGPCFCVDLCVPEAPPRTEPIPAFRYIGGYNYLTDVDSGSGGSGLTLSDHRAFYSGLRLSGPIGTTLNGQPLEYRFEVMPEGGSWTAVLPAQILPTLIGYSEKLVGVDLEVSTVVVNGVASATEIAVTPDAQGWIPMPSEGNLSTGLFTPNLNMIVLDTTTIATWTPIDVSSISAGTSLPSSDLASDQLFGIRLRVREAGLPLTEIDGGTCTTLAVDNTLYNNVSKGGTWSPSKASDQLAVVSLDIQELPVNGCVGIDSTLTVLVTNGHPNLGTVSLGMTGSGSSYGFTLPAATPGQISGIATDDFTVSTLPKCAYIVTLSAEVLLTTGDSVPLPVYDQLAFCKT